MSKTTPRLISFLVPVFAVISFALALGSVSIAGSTASVTATVTVQNISLSVLENATVTYGTLGQAATKDTTAAGGQLNTSPLVVNDGNITEDIVMKGQNTAAWTLSSDTTANNYFHNWCTSDCDGTPSWTALTSAYGEFIEDIASANSSAFDLQIGTPVTTSSYSQQSVDVSLMATTPD